MTYQAISDSADQRKQAIMLRDFYASLLDVAYRQEHLGIFEDLLFRFGFNPNYEHLNGETLLHRIVRDGKIQYAERMLRAGINLNAVSGQGSGIAIGRIGIGGSGETKQARANTQRVTEQILQARSTQQSTPIMQAVAHGQVEMLRWLLRNGADPRVRGSLGMNAMNVATSLPTWLPKSTTNVELNPEIILLLLEQGLSVDQINTTELGQEANGLFYACQNGDRRAAEFLVGRFAADPNLEMSQKIEADKTKAAKELHAIIAQISQAGHIQVCKVSCFVKAVHKKHFEIVKYLLAQDIKPLSKETLLNAQAATNDSKIQAAIDVNLGKLTRLEKAQTALTAQDYKACIEECAQAAEFKTWQYDEALLEVQYQAYLGVNDNDKACEYLTRYLVCLQRKHEQILTPEIKAALQAKITNLRKRADAGAGNKEIMGALKSSSAGVDSSVPGFSELELKSSDLAAAAVSQHSSSPFASRFPASSPAAVTRTATAAQQSPAPGQAATV